ncbi:hypothetical protein JE959_000152 [Aeromonas veronii]|nr:hypothetical protein [Aeromonas veronii]
MTKKETKKTDFRQTRREAIYKYLDDKFLNRKPKALFTVNRIRRDLSEQISKWGELYGLDTGQKVTREIRLIVLEYGVDVMGATSEIRHKKGRPTTAYRVNKENGKEYRENVEFQKRVKALYALKEATMLAEQQGKEKK